MRADWSFQEWLQMFKMQFPITLLSIFLQRPSGRAARLWLGSPPFESCRAVRLRLGNTAAKGRADRLLLGSFSRKLQGSRLQAGQPSNLGHGSLRQAGQPSNQGKGSPPMAGQPALARKLQGSPPQAAPATTKGRAGILCKPCTWVLTVAERCT
jgi:hypothetical protein